MIQSISTYRDTRFSKTRQWDKSVKVTDWDSKKC